MLVFDFGGGTLDFTVMRIGDPRHREVLAVAGIPVAGDIFDQKLVRSRLPRHFGEGSRYGIRGRERPVPEWIYDTFSSWQEIITLQTPDNMAMLRDIARTAREPRKIEALIAMVSSHYSLKMFDTVERAKRTLSRRTDTVIQLTGPGFNVSQPVTRAEFENILHEDVRAVETQLDEVVKASGLRLDQIDAVIRTGGSSQIPVFQGLLDRKFGPDKVRSVDIFSSVTSGLGIIAHGIETGAVEARAFVKGEHGSSELTAAHPKVPRADLELVKKRMAAEQSLAAGASAGPATVLVVHAHGNQVLTAEMDRRSPAGSPAMPLSEIGLADGLQAQRLLFAAPDEPLLFVTTRYRFLLLSWRELRSYAEQGVSLADVHHFPPEEEICCVEPWEQLKECAKLILVTNRGHAALVPHRTDAHRHRGPAPLQPRPPGARRGGRRAGGRQ